MVPPETDTENDAIHPMTHSPEAVLACLGYIEKAVFLTTASPFFYCKTPSIGWMGTIISLSVNQRNKNLIKKGT
ncbi:MAG: hypothetical protein CL609_17945 [Anaerolineaceae bacterium]|nr:hypothetical protein [Anaerolineaceae bacterium]